MPLTTLEEMELEVHEKFDQKPPTKEEAGEFLVKCYPRMDAGLLIAIAGLILAAWQVGRGEVDRWRQARQSSGGGGKCPQCTEDDIKKNRQAGKAVCEHGYKV